MAPRRGTRVVKVEQSIDYDNLTVKEVLCPICRSILIEPVTLPCNHVFCFSCFQGTMENANLVCPLCRLRIGSWLRLCKKENKLINIDYWNAIKRLFPEQIKNKLQGVEDNLNYEDPLIKIAKPGELKKEYETQKRKESESFKKEREAEIKASEALINKLQEEEEYRKIIEEEKLRLDEEIARKLAEELNTGTEHKVMKEPYSGMKTSNNKINTKKNGPLDRFLQSKSGKNTSGPEKKIDYAKKDYTCRVLCHDISNDWEKDEEMGHSLSMLNQQISLELQHALDMADHSDSSDSIESECRYFKPIDYRRSIPSQKVTPIRVPAIRGTVKIGTIMAPKGQNMLKNDIFNTAFVAFGKMSLEENEQIDNKYLGQIKKGKSVITEKVHESRKNIPEKKSNIQSERSEPNQLTPLKKEQNKSKPTASVKRKFFQTPSDYVSPRKRDKPDLNDSFARFLDSPGSPFKGFCLTELEEKRSRRLTKNTKIVNSFSKCSVDSDEVKRQVESDYELAKKLQQQFNSSSYLTRSSAPRRCTKISRQATLDNMLSKPSKC